MSRNVEVVRELYRAFGAKDETALRRVLHPDVAWIQCAGFPGGASRQGVEQVLDQVFRGLRSTWRDWRVDIDEYLDAGDTVVVLGQYAGTHAQTGRAMTAVFAHVYDIDAGRITRFRQVTDTHQLVRAAEEK